MDLCFVSPASQESRRCEKQIWQYRMSSKLDTKRVCDGGAIHL